MGRRGPREVADSCGAAHGDPRSPCAVSRGGIRRFLRTATCAAFRRLPTLIEQGRRRPPSPRRGTRCCSWCTTSPSARVAASRRASDRPHVSGFDSLDGNNTELNPLDGITRAQDAAHAQPHGRRPDPAGPTAATTTATSGLLAGLAYKSVRRTRRTASRRAPYRPLRVPPLRGPPPAARTSARRGWAAAGRRVPPGPRCQLPTELMTTLLV